MRGLVLALNLAFLLAPVGAWAQLDSSSAILLRPSGRPTSPQNLDSSRYKVRQPEGRKDDSELEEKPGTLIPSPVPPRTSSPRVQPVKTQAAPTPASPPAHTSAAPPTTDPNSASDAAVEAELNAERPAPPVVTQVRELILGGSQEDIDEYKKQVHPQDPRANTLNISIAPGYYYNGSESQYALRRYNSHGPALGLGMNLWVTPFFGVQSRFFTSVGASQRSGGQNMVPTDIQTFDAGVRFRKHFGYSRKAAQLGWGVDYHDAINKIGRDSTTALGRKSSGVSIAMEGVIPTSVNYAHTFQVDVRPRLKHGETQTGISARSGSKNETNALSLGLGGQWTLDRRNQVFWRGQYSVERNIFNGRATTADPQTGQNPEGVSVTNSLLMFHFGFRWGS